jgi:hypothetical protein
MKEALTGSRWMGMKIDIPAMSGGQQQRLFAT